MFVPSRPMRALSAAAIALGLALGVGGAASAGSYAVEPSWFTLVPPVRNATITLTNLSSEPIRLEVTGLAWAENDNGVTRLTPSSDILVFPRLMTIPALGRQLVRAAVVGPLRPSEQAFRIVIEELPALAEIVHATDGARISIRTRFTLPVYVEPVNPAPSSRIEDVAVRDGVLTFALLNTGNIHAAGSALFVNGRDAGGRNVLSNEIGDWHVLVGERRVYTVDIGKNTCLRHLTISPSTGAVPPAQTVNVAACG
jgi:fimbrial chaperone protein